MAARKLVSRILVSNVASGPNLSFCHEPGINKTEHAMAANATAAAPPTNNDGGQATGTTDIAPATSASTLAIPPTPTPGAREGSQTWGYDPGPTPNKGVDADLEANGFIRCPICQHVVRGGRWALRQHQLASSKCQHAASLMPAAREQCANCGRWIAAGDSWAKRQHAHHCHHGHRRQASCPPATFQGRRWNTAEEQPWPQEDWNRPETYFHREWREYDSPPVELGDAGANQRPLPQSPPTGAWVERSHKDHSQDIPRHDGNWAGASHHDDPWRWQSSWRWGHDSHAWSWSTSSHWQDWPSNRREAGQWQWH